MKAFYFSFCFICIATTLPIILQHRDDKIYNCLKTIFSTFYNEKLLILNNTNNYNLNWLLNNVSYQLMNFDNFELWRNLIYFDSYLIFLQNIGIIETYLNENCATNCFNSYAKVIIVYSGPYDDLQNILEILWKYYLTNLIILTTSLDVYTYHPLINCNVSKPTFLFKCENYQPIQLESDTQYFPNCTFRAYAVELRPYIFSESYEENTGFEILMLREIERRLKFKVIYTISNYPFSGNKLENGSYTFIFQDLQLNVPI